MKVTIKSAFPVVGSAENWAMGAARVVGDAVKVAVGGSVVNVKVAVGGTSVEVGVGVKVACG